MTLPVTSQAAFAATIVDEWIRAGVTDAVVTPGSRSTPLTLAVAEAEGAGRLRVHVVLDERSAGFRALGVGLATGRPAPIVTTSGTAAGHLVPALMEASAAGVPMLACTADRPPELHQVGAAQTAEQVGMYANFVRFEQSIDATLPATAWRSVAARALIEAAHGPVHLNLAFRDPLVASPGDRIPAGRPDGGPWHTATTAWSGTIGLRTRLSARTGLIVATSGIADPALVLDAAAALGWPILAGPRSGCRTAGSQSAVVVSAFDGVLRWPALPRPEVVMRLGGVPASRVANEWLDGLTDSDHVVVDPHGAWIDPGRAAIEIVRATPEAVCRSITSLNTAPAPDGWAAPWRHAETVAQQTIERVLGAQSNLTEPQVARILTGALDDGTTLVVASSMPIRDVESYGAPSTRARVLANRGVNGIDGTIATAVGAAASGVPVVALLGDLAFLHDAGSMLGATGDCTLVVVDNDGGGIFSFLPQAAELPDAMFERYWGTPHGVSIAAVAAAYGAVVEEVDTVTDLRAAVAEPRGIRVVIVRTDRATNVTVHDELVAALGARLGEGEIGADNQT